MTIKINFLVIVVFLILFILIVNAAEERVNNTVNQTLDLNELDVVDVNEKLEVNNNTIENNQNNKNQPKAVTASFGVYLEIAG